MKKTITMKLQIFLKMAGVHAAAAAASLINNVRKHHRPLVRTLLILIKQARNANHVALLAPTKRNALGKGNIFDAEDLKTT